jgi:putative transposase
MWTPTTRAQHSRTGLRYGSDLTDAEWDLLSPFLPPACAKGRHRKWAMREIVNAIFFVLRGGCAWSMLPKCFPPWSTVYRWFARFRDDGTWERSIITWSCSTVSGWDARPAPRRP